MVSSGPYSSESCSYNFHDFIANKKGKRGEDLGNIEVNSLIIIGIKETFMNSKFELVLFSHEYFYSLFVNNCQDFFVCDCLNLFFLSTMAGYEFDYIFDCTILKYQQTQRTKSQPRICVSALLII